jgi:Holliday junction DNA helicase RuvA
VRHQQGSAATLHTPSARSAKTAFSLYGFESEEELSDLELLLTVSGVGPKVALSALSSLAPMRCVWLWPTGRPA